MTSTQAPYPWLKSYPEGLQWDQEIPLKPAYALIEDAVRTYPDNPFMDFLSRRTTYAEGYELINRFAAGLQRLGLKKGDRVGLLLPNISYYVIAYYAILKAGGVVVNFNPLYPAKEIEHHLQDAQVEILITVDLKLTHDKVAPLLGKSPLKHLIMCSLAEALPFPKNMLYPIAKRKETARWQPDSYHKSFRDVLAAPGTKPAPVEIDPAKDLAALQYTGGTTGIPKGAMLTHGNIYANAVQSGWWFQGSQPGKEKMLGVLPFFHVFAMTAVMNLAIRLGAEIIMLPQFNLNEVMKTITKKKPTLFPAVPTIYTAIINHPNLKDYDLSSIKECISGGAPLPLEVRLQFEKLTGCKLVEGYGLSETSPVASCNPMVGKPRLNSIGLPVPGTIISIRSLEDPMVEVPMGERGEVCIKGPQVMAGYWNNPQATESVMLPGGFLRTGDVGIFDEDGYISIVDRIKDMIICSGFNVYPRNVEEAIYLHPSVSEVIVAGVPDQYRGQTVKAYIKLKEEQTLTAEELELFLKDKLSPMERPKLIEFRDTLPKTMIGKLSRKALLEEEAAKAAQG